MVREVVLIAVVIAGVVSLPVPSQAQIGSGWVEYTPPKSLQIRGCAAHEAAGGVETFRLICADTGGDNRAEQRIENDYSSGTNQFEGEVRVVSVGANIIVKQTFMPNRGAFLMIAVAADGRLYIHGGGGDVASGVVGRWVRINTIHDVSAGTHEIYADGVLKVTKRGGGQVAWHDKFGSYRSQSGRGPVTVEWRNTRFWRGGRSSGQTDPKPADAGVLDAADDVAPSPGDGPSNPDAANSDLRGSGAGGSGTGGTGGAGTGGTGGVAVAGSGGANATGGTAGSAPRPGRTGGDSGMATPGAGGGGGRDGGCAMGGPTRSAGALALIGLLLARFALRRRRTLPADSAC